MQTRTHTNTTHTHTHTVRPRVCKVADKPGTYCQLINEIVTHHPAAEDELAIARPNNMRGRQV